LNVPLRPGLDRSEERCGSHIVVYPPAELDRIDAKIIEAGIDLLTQEIDGRHVHCRHAARVLGGECGDRRKAVQPMRSEGLEIGLNTCATARIGAGDSKNAVRASEREMKLPAARWGDHNANRNGAAFVSYSVGRSHRSRCAVAVV
jgi:hypothetical protein